MLNFMKMYSPSLTIALDIALDQVNDSNP
jgi:hypothetical protein